MRVDGYSHAEILSTIAPYPGSCLAKKFSDFMGNLGLREHKAIATETRDPPSLFLTVWEQVKGDFEAEFVPGHPEWGEVSL